MNLKKSVRIKQYIALSVILLCMIFAGAYLVARLVFPQFFGFWYHDINLKSPQYEATSFVQEKWMTDKSLRSGMLNDLEKKIQGMDRAALMSLLGPRDGAYMTQADEISYSLGEFHRENKKEKCSLVIEVQDSGIFKNFGLWCRPESR